MFGSKPALDYFKFQRSLSKIWFITSKFHIFDSDWITSSMIFHTDIFIKRFKFFIGVFDELCSGAFFIKRCNFSQTVGVFFLEFTCTWLHFYNYQKRLTQRKTTFLLDIFILILYIITFPLAISEAFRWPKSDARASRLAHR